MSDLGFFNGPLEFVRDNQVIPIPTEKGNTKTIQLRVLFTPGHAEDHICVLMEDHLGQATAVFTGDAILADFLSKNSHSVWIGESELLRSVYPEVPQLLHMAALLNLRHSLFWIASDSESLPSPVNFPRNSLIARISDGSKRIIDVADFYYLLDCFERFQSPTPGFVVEDVKHMLGTDWEWKFSA
ncbi:hypothetical protein EG68_08949 [Paragonimus skrjabini miyazakii]|uniref:Metallo-beta-lactamase domain-containing protein n=1 Tax=Paragonimus skrjabini miyazakii TaxID=59628 RepID=A0A8S9YQW7_9TREM|nr:hypothetical protein EG68_08949 [Paragonimus skrjabini miyazakii]